MAITATSTLADIKGEYLSNASYEENDSVAECKAFITAARALLVMLPQAAGGFGGSPMAQFHIPSVTQALEQAKLWLAGRSDGSSGGGRVTHVDLREFRT